MHSGSRNKRTQSKQGKEIRYMCEGVQAHFMEVFEHVRGSGRARGTGGAREQRRKRGEGRLPSM